MKLKAIYDKKEDIPEGFESAYVERNGKFELQVEGMKTSADVERIQTALDKERDDHKTAKRRLKGLGDDEDGDTVQDLKDKVEDLEWKLETAGKDSVSEDDVQKRGDAGGRTDRGPGGGGKRPASGGRAPAGTGFSTRARASCVAKAGWSTGGCMAA